MAGISHTDWTFELGGPRKPVLKKGEIIPFVGEPERWRQYNDPIVYELDSLIRDWIAAMSENARWCRYARRRRYTMSMIFEQIYGRKFDTVAGSHDYKVSTKMSRILRYYSSRVQNGGSIAGKHYSKTIYVISPKRLEKPPYSLRLRIEWLSARGELPDMDNMALPKDNLGIGHARNPKTERNMKRRSEMARKRYNERYKRDHR